MRLHNSTAFIMNPTHPISVTLIGCGGTGSLLLSRLARMDFALRSCGKAGISLTVYDDDRVEMHNIGRQMFTTIDVGENKAVCLVSKINRCFGTTFRAIPERFDLDMVIKRIEGNHSGWDNIFITAVDNVDFRIGFDHFFKKVIKELQVFANNGNRLHYWMDVGNAKNVGQCVLASIPIEQPNESDFCERLPTVVDRFPNIKEMDVEELQGRGCSYQEKLEEQNLFINDAISAHASHLLWELLANGYLSKAGFFMNLENFNTNAIRI